MAFARVVDLVACRAEGGEERLDGGDDGAGWGDVVALVREVAAFFADLRALGGV